MVKLTFPVLFIVLAIGLFFVYVDPTYKEVQNTLIEEERFDQAFDKSKELQAVRDKLLSKYNTFSSNDLDRLSKLLPDHVDNVRLVLDIDHIASTYGMRMKNVVVDSQEERQEGVIGPDTSEHQSIALLFSVSSSYESLKLFIRDLERSLRIVDITGISLTSATAIEGSNNLYEYNIALKTYWLKN
ncbi:MAG: type 4a pilus biogenesis protein PilO [Parcubacteria group bacterium]|nr:type 4a pilus biogenesis protein PilO [Parcubacteria group bacterium]